MTSNTDAANDRSPKAQTTRDQIVAASDRLFYEQGFAATSFADIANAVEISRGNFYYHFKTKDEILAAVITLRLANTRRMLDDWSRDADTPAARIRCFAHILIANQAKIMLHGCPVGTLSNELAKLDHDARGDAGRIFELFRTWLREQFAELGCGADADDLALHLLARSQGISTLANALRDADFVAREVADIATWLDAVAARHAPAARVKSRARKAAATTAGDGRRPRAKPRR